MKIPFSSIKFLQQPTTHSEVSTQTQPSCRTTSLSLLKPGKPFAQTPGAGKLCILQPVQPEGDLAISFETVSNASLLPSTLHPLNHSRVQSHDYHTRTSTLASPMNWVNSLNEVVGPASSGFRSHEAFLEHLASLERIALRTQFDKELAQLPGNPVASSDDKGLVNSNPGCESS